jgi:hypothetical protein
MIDIEYVSGMVIHGLLLLLKNSELPFTKFTVRYSGCYEFMREKAYWQRDGLWVGKVDC